MVEVLVYFLFLATPSSPPFDVTLKNFGEIRVDTNEQTGALMKLQLFFIVDDASRDDTLRFYIRRIGDLTLNDSFYIYIKNIENNKSKSRQSNTYFLQKTIHVGGNLFGINEKNNLTLEYEFAKGFRLSHEFEIGSKMNTYAGIFNLKGSERGIIGIRKISMNYIFLDYSKSFSNYLSEKDESLFIQMVHGTPSPDTNTPNIVSINNKIYKFYCKKDPPKVVFIEMGINNNDTSKGEVTLFDDFFSALKDTLAEKFKEYKSNNKKISKVLSIFIISDGINDTTKPELPTGCDENLSEKIINSFDSLRNSMWKDYEIILEVIPLLILDENRRDIQKNCIDMVWKKLLIRSNFVVYDILDKYYYEFKYSRDFLFLGEKKGESIGNKRVIWDIESYGGRKSLFEWFNAYCIQDIFLITNIDAKSISIYHPEKYKASTLKIYKVNFLEDLPILERDLSRIEELKDIIRIKSGENIKRIFKPVFGRLLTLRRFNCKISIIKDPNTYYHIIKAYIYVNDSNYIELKNIKNTKNKVILEIPYRLVQDYQVYNGRLIMASSNPLNQKNSRLEIVDFNLPVYGKKFHSMIFFLYDTLYLFVFFIGLGFLTHMIFRNNRFFYNILLISIFLSIIFDLLGYDYTVYSLFLFVIFALLINLINLNRRGMS